MQIASNVAIQTFKVWFLPAALMEETVGKIGMTLIGSFFTLVGTLCSIGFQAMKFVHVYAHACMFAHTGSFQMHSRHTAVRVQSHQ